MNNNIIGFTEGKDMMSTDVVCWFCQNPLSPRALFCNHCGAIQPVRALDHFTRLGLERKIEIDFSTLERHFSTMQKTLDPDRFAIRSATERVHATKQLEALVAAYDALRDPVQRGRYWLKLHDKVIANTTIANPLVQKLQEACEEAASAPDIDHVARQASQALEDGVMKLMLSLRQQNWQNANQILLELDCMEIILNAARGKRRLLTEKK